MIDYLNFAVYYNPLCLNMQTSKGSWLWIHGLQGGRGPGQEAGGKGKKNAG